jgi:4-hydroxy-3-methylbut-2-enyl diphosphate reductase
LEVIKAKNIGFCFGVSRAVQIALDAACDNCVVTYGDIIHNPQVVEYLKQKGITSVESIDGLKNNNKLIIRSHGVEPDIYEKCKQLGVEVIDATCPYVSRIQRKAKYCYDNDIQLIIFGEATHPEIIGINGWAGKKSIIITNVEQAKELHDINKAVLVAQTTADRELWNEVVEVVKDKVEDLDIFDSICESTCLRQKEAEDISKKSDMVLVIGGKHSSNTKKLYNICKKNCENTYHVETIDEIKSIDFTNIINVGIISGASTPDWIIKEGLTIMSDLNKTTEMNDELKQDKDKVVVEQTAKEKVEEKVEEKKEVKETVIQENNENTSASNEVAEVNVSQSDVDEKKLQESFMEDIEKSMVTIKTGMIVKGKVVTVNNDEVCVNIGYKADGIVTKQEFSLDQDITLSEAVKEGDEFEVEVLRVRDEDGNVLLSRKNVESRKNWQLLLDTYKDQEYFDCIGKQVVKGGLIATINGIRAFIPASHLDVRYVNDITEYVGEQMKVKIIEIEKHRRRVVASRKQYILDEEKRHKDEIWDAIEEGSTVRGVVRRLTDFGVFVDIGGSDGLVHVTDLAWGRVNHPKDIVTVNQEIDVVVLKVDKDRERISLGYKQTMPKPWDVAEDKYPIGSIITGKVVRIVPFGAFVELEPGLDGLIHISQVANERIEKVEDVLELNQEVEVKVLDINIESRRISLSIRALSAPDEDEYEDDDASSVLVDTSQY